MYDLNNSGLIDFNELHTIVKTLLKLKYSLSSELISDDNKEKNELIFLQFQNLIFKENQITNLKLPLSYNIAMYIMQKLDVSRKAKLTKQEFVNGCLDCENIRIFLSPLKFI